MPSLLVLPAGIIGTAEGLLLSTPFAMLVYSCYTEQRNLSDEGRDRALHQYETGILIGRIVMEQDHSDGVLASMGGGLQTEDL